jgi:hypothetical protein
VYIGLRDSAFHFGRPDFRTEEALQGFLAAHTRQGLLGWLLREPPQVPPGVAAFVRLLRLLRQALEVLCRQPITADTGESPTVFSPRSMADGAAVLANAMTRTDNYICRVKLPSGEEHQIRTYPAPEGVTADALASRLQAVKERMLELGYCRYARDVEKEVEERHEALRRPDGERPRRRRDREPPPPAYG